MYDYLDDFVCDTTCEEYWSDWENWDDYEEEYIDTPSGYAYGAHDSQITYAATTYTYDWSDWDI